MAVHAAHETPELVTADHRGAASRRQFLIFMGMLVTFAWLTLWIWEQSPYGRYLDHGRWTEIGLAGSICRVLPNGTVVLPALLYVGGWVLMTVAMMLPTTIPLLETFRRLISKRQDAGRLVTLVVAGYFTVWLLFGIAAHLLDWGVNEAVRQSVWLGLNGWVLGVIVLGTAGVFQFTDLKYRCLDRCRAPLSFIVQHWRGHAVQQQAFVIGVHHGIYCVGCCWALMLLMFIVGTGSVGWMLLLGAVMAMEKNLPIGRLIGKSLGVVLLGAAAIVTSQHDALSLF